MKKICLTVFAASAMIFSTQNLSAQQVVEDKIVVEHQVKDFEQIDVANLPAEVQQAVERDYEGAEVTEAYVKEKEGEKKYKLLVTTVDGEELELYADAQGNWIEKEDK